MNWFNVQNLKSDVFSEPETIKTSKKMVKVFYQKDLNAADNDVKYQNVNV